MKKKHSDSKEKMEFSRPTLSPSSSLLCKESQTSFDCEEPVEKYTILEEDDEDYLQILLNREINGNGVPKKDIDNDLSVDWIKEARIDAIQYIFRTGFTFGFQIQTGYLAVTYMDRFLCSKFIKEEKYWIVQLLAIACLSLAAKMEESKVPTISRFVEKNYNFENRMIQRMELMVLDTLEWKMKLPTPFDFIHYFLKMFCINNSTTSVSKVIEVLLKTIKDEMTIEDSPSSIAAAATLFTSNQTLTKESLPHKINPLYCSTCLNIEEIISLYSRLKQQKTRNLELSNKSISPPFSPYSLWFAADATENPTKYPYAVGSKRKSLIFGESNKNIDEEDDTKRLC